MPDTMTMAAIVRELHDRYCPECGTACERCVSTDAGLVCQADLGGQCQRASDPDA